MIKRKISYLGAFYLLELAELGSEGFADWLVKSFLGDVPAPVGPHFMTDELYYQVFGDVFSSIIDNDLEEEHKEIARQGVRTALSTLSQQNYTWEGLYTFAALVHGLKMLDERQQIIDAVQNKDAGEQTQTAKTPDQAWRLHVNNLVQKMQELADR